jgi:alkylation response protein AidB-like acyl-CoA dehydrogenase
MFPLTEEQRALQARAHRFALEVVAPHVEGMDRTNEYPWPVVKALAQQRFMGMTIPREYGGQGRSLLDSVLVVEEIAKICGTVARIVVDANMGIVGAIKHYGSPSPPLPPRHRRRRQAGHRHHRAGGGVGRHHADHAGGA